MEILYIFIDICGLQIIIHVIVKIIIPSIHKLETNIFRSNVVLGSDEMILLLPDIIFFSVLNVCQLNISNIISKDKISFVFSCPFSSNYVKYYFLVIVVIMKNSVFMHIYCGVLGSKLWCYASRYLFTNVSISIVMSYSA